MRQLASHTVKHLTSARQISSRPRRTLCTRQLSASRSKLRMCVSSARNTLQHLYEQALSTFNSRQQPQDLRQLEAVQTALREFLPYKHLHNIAFATHSDGLFLTRRRRITARAGLAAVGMSSPCPVYELLRHLCSSQLA